MQDPLRIPGVLDAVRRVWEGQPDLSLPTLFGVLGNRGIGWGAGDEDLLRELARMERVRPGVLPLLDARVTARWLLVTEDPGFRVLVDPWRVIARRAGVSAQPGVWRYGTLRPAVVGGPLVVTSAEGIDHRLGRIRSITLLDASPSRTVASLSGLRRREVGDAVHLVSLAGGETVLLSRTLEVLAAGRRHLDHEVSSWESVVSGTPGEEFTVQPPGGGPVRRYGVVEEILLVEDAPADD